MAIGLIDVDSKIPNLVLMKISNYYKCLGEEVEFVQESKEYEKIYASTIFTRSKDKVEKLIEKYGDKIEIGGTGWDIKKELPIGIEKTKPDYDLYSAQEIAARMKGIMTKEKKLKKATEIVNAGMGFTSRGCVRNCGFCFVPTKEGKFHDVAEIKDIINPKSNVMILHDNNFTADPYCVDKLKEIKKRKLIVDINQGCDVRLMNDEKAYWLGQVRHLRSVHYAWDLMDYEDKVLEGIEILSKYVKKYKHMCFMLVGFNTTFEEDMYRFRKLTEMKVDPFVMIYNQKNDVRLKHFARWVNGRIYKKCKFEEYGPWIKAQVTYNQLSFI
ncbi:radical SAM protein [Terrisporobacter hibernicus]|uniref:Radical SAM protein n=1 Tax=Terrisporobacter hibernicus TaxID=2813371 RepID=A0AAX2ZEU0_9FIRM|nr:radical SAM protein [Terrisporobacter hibernicus]UEL47556.1 radical SAM protein [Terrisporobacter hibernicus]